MLNLSRRVPQWRRNAGSWIIAIRGLHRVRARVEDAQCQYYRARWRLSTVVIAVRQLFASAISMRQLRSRRGRRSNRYRAPFP